MSAKFYRLRWMENFGKKLFAFFALRFLKPGAPGPDSGPLGSVLVLRQDHLGDFILTVPSIRALQRRLAPGDRLTLVASPSNVKFARFIFPGLRILVYGKYPWQRLPLMWKILTGHFDTVVVFHSVFSTTAALLTVLSGATRRVGYWQDGSEGEISRIIFNSGLKPPPETQRESLRYFRLVQSLKAGKGATPEIYSVPAVPAETASRVDGFFKQCGIGPKDRVLGIQPTLRKECNCWPQDKYLELLRRLAGIPRLKVVVLYGLGEEEAVKRFMEKAADVKNLYPLPENGLLYMLETARCLDAAVMGDSGLTHLMALQTTIFEIFGPSDPGLWAPLGKHKIFRAKDRLCGSVEAKPVAAAVRAKLSKSR